MSNPFYHELPLPDELTPNEDEDELLISAQKLFEVVQRIIATHPKAELRFLAHHG